MKNNNIKKYTFKIKIEKFKIKIEKFKIKLAHKILMVIAWLIFIFAILVEIIKNIKNIVIAWKKYIKMKTYNFYLNINKKISTTSKNNIIIIVNWILFGICFTLTLEIINIIIQIFR